MIGVHSLNGWFKAFINDPKLPTLTLPLTFFLVLVVYILSMPKDLTWSYFGGDGGELITASLTLGIPHPPGYPTYILLGRVFSLLPIGTLAGRFHLFSALSMSLAAVFVTKISLDHALSAQKDRYLPSNRLFIPAVAAGLIFAFSPLIWSQAIIAEVYALNLVLLAGLLWMLLSCRSPLLAGVLFGLSITSHLTSIFMLPLCLFILDRRHWPHFFIGSLLGLAPFLILFGLANSTSPIIWGQPDNLRDWLWLVSGRLYQPNIFSMASEHWGKRIVSWLLLFMGQFVILVATMLQLRRHPNWMAVRRIVLLLLLTTLLYFVYAFGYDTPDAIVLLLPGLLLLSIVIGLGIMNLGRFSLVYAVLILAIGGYFLITEKEAVIRDDFELALTQLPQGAIAITPGDQTISATWYFAYAEGQRPDLIVVDNNLFQFSWYRRQLAATHPELKELSKDDLDMFIGVNSLQFTVCWLALDHRYDVICTSAPS